MEKTADLGEREAYAEFQNNFREESLSGPFHIMIREEQRIGWILDHILSDPEYDAAQTDLAKAFYAKWAAEYDRNH